MSYSLLRKCSSCIHKVNCIDSSFVMGAISGIHQANYNDSQRQVHLGCGEITINCNNYKNENGIRIEDIVVRSVFKRNDIIKTDGEQFQCVCVDIDIAIFAPMDYDKKEKSNITHYENMFAVGNLPSLIGNFTYEIIE